jgi:hypothetical protein
VNWVAREDSFDRQEKDKVPIVDRSLFLPKMKMKKYHGRGYSLKWDSIPVQMGLHENNEV